MKGLPRWIDDLPVPVEIIDPGGKRANPYHDEKGKFTTGPGGGGGWKHETAADIEAANLASWEKEAGRKLTPSEMEDLKPYISAYDVRQRVTKGNMNIDVRADGVSRADLIRLTNHIDRLQSTFPIEADGGKLQFNVREPRSMPDNVSGETVHGRGFMNISSDVVTNAPGWDNSHLMPSAKTTDRMSYIVAHEWGHATDNDKAQLLWAEHFLDLSDYGMSSPHEAKAEAFADWVVTKGRTTNPASTHYAKELGWGVMS